MNYYISGDDKPKLTKNVNENTFTTATSLSSDMWLLMSAGAVPGVFTVNKFGRNGDIDTNTDPEDVWAAGGTYTFLSAADQLDVVGGATDVMTTGTGAWKVVIQGLDANWNLLSEEVEMNGAGGVTTTNSFLRVFRAWVSDAGTGGVNEAQITIKDNTAGTVTLATIETGDGQTEMAIYSIPADHTAFMISWWISINKQGAAAGLSARMGLFARYNEGTTNPVIRRKESMGTNVDGNSFFERHYTPYKVFGEKQDIYVRAIEVSANDADVSAGFDLIVVENAKKEAFINFMNTLK